MIVCKCGCGSEVLVKKPGDHGPQRLYATNTCRSRDTAKASRARKSQGAPIDDDTKQTRDGCSPDGERA
jgi:hypothetical protein